MRPEFIAEIKVPPGRSNQGTVVLTEAGVRDPILERWRNIPENMRPKFRDSVMTLGKDNSLPRKRRTAKYHAGCEKYKRYWPQNIT